MDYPEALSHLKKGKRIRRAGWNGKGMFLFHVPATDVPSSNYQQLDGIFPQGSMVGINAWIAMKTVDNTIVPWLCSQTDALSDDWEIMHEAQRA